jgi:hypothetical protein
LLTMAALAFILGTPLHNLPATFSFLMRKGA